MINAAGFFPYVCWMNMSLITGDPLISLWCYQTTTIWLLMICVTCKNNKHRYMCVSPVQHRGLAYTHWTLGHWSQVYTSLFCWHRLIGICVCVCDLYNDKWGSPTLDHIICHNKNKNLGSGAIIQSHWTVNSFTFTNLTNTIERHQTGMLSFEKGGFSFLRRF